MEEKLYVAWRDPIKRAWYPVGILTVDENKTYSFIYTREAMRNNFVGFAKMPDKNSVYSSNELFHLFNNRILSNGRPEYKQYLHWLDIDESNYSPLKMLTITEGIKATDNLEFFQCPLPNSNGEYEVKFLIHGLRYLSKGVLERVNSLKNGDRLFIIPDIQNEYDSKAVAFRTEDPPELIGYCPRYLSPDFLKLLSMKNPEDVNVFISRVNNDAPIDLRLLCKIITTWPDDFEACDYKEFKPMVDRQATWKCNAKVKTPRASIGVSTQSNEDFKSMVHHDDISSNSKSQTARSIASSKDEYENGGKATMNQYGYGRRKEHKVAKSLRGKGASVKVSPGSKGAADLKVSFSPARKWNVQVKSSRGPSPASPSRRDLGRLKQGASRTGAPPVVAEVTPKRTTYKSARTGRKLKP